MSYKQGDILKIYKETPVFKAGAVVQVLDYDPTDHSFLVARLQDIGRHNCDLTEVIKNESLWVKESDTEIVSFNRPNKIVMFFKQIKSKLNEWTQKLSRKLFRR